MVIINIKIYVVIVADSAYLIRWTRESCRPNSPPCAGGNPGHCPPGEPPGRHLDRDTDTYRHRHTGRPPGRHLHRDTDTYRHRHTEIQTHRQSTTCTNSHRHTVIRHTDIETHKTADTQKQSTTYTDSHKHRVIHTHRDADTHGYRHT